VAGDRDDNVDTRGAPYKIWEGKKCPKFGAIFDNFRLFKRNYISSPIGWKNLVNFGPLTKKL